MVARAHARVSRDGLHAACGIRTMPINTFFRLLAAARRARRSCPRGRGRGSASNSTRRCSTSGASPRVKRALVAACARPTVYEPRVGGQDICGRFLAVTGLTVDAWEGPVTTGSHR
jgi:hypothetical protein